MINKLILINLSSSETHKNGRPTQNVALGNVFKMPRIACTFNSSSSSTVHHKFWIPHNRPTVLKVSRPQDTRHLALVFTGLILQQSTMHLGINGHYITREGICCYMGRGEEKKESTHNYPIHPHSTGSHWLCFHGPICCEKVYFFKEAQFRSLLNCYFVQL